MQFRLFLLGTFEMRWGEQAVTLSTTAGRALLGYLALERHRRHSREAVASLLWPDQSQATAYANLRQTLARLRKALPDDSAPALIDSSQQTLQWSGAPDAVDVARFERLLAQCAAHPHTDITDCPACIERCEEAIALYRGELLQGLFLPDNQPFEEWLLFKREQFHRQALATLDTLTRHTEATGDYARVQAYAARQLALEPWRESAHMAAMRSLARSGQRAAALAQYESCRRVLEEQLGIEPSVETHALYERIRADELGLGVAIVSPPHHSLPAQLTPFVGRERELAELVGQLAQPEVRLVTLVGPGGMGKTRLALEAARTRLTTYSDGIYFVALAPLTTAAGIVPAIAATIGVTLHGGEPRQALLKALRAKQMLLLLDNFEHLLAGVELVVALLEDAPGVQILATSRERLNVRGEHVYDVQALEYESEATLITATASGAVRLFVQSARRVQPRFMLDAATMPAVLRICQLVYGMPLGLELAAGWLEMLPLGEIVAEIEQSADFLATELRAAPPRHRSLRAVFDWSWHLLEPADQQVFKQLAVFRGGFTRDAAQTIVGASLRGLTRLLHTSLLRWGETSGTVGRYELHELLRQFAAEQLDAVPSEQAAVATRHSTYYLRFVTEREVRLARHDPQAAALEIRGELDNIRQAWTWAATHPELADLDRSAHSLRQWYAQAGLSAESEAAFGLAVAAVRTHWEQACDTATRLHSQRVLSKLQAIYAATMLPRSNYDEAIALAEEAVALGQTSNGVEGETLGCFVCAAALYWKGQQLEARARMEQALALAQRYLRHQPTHETLGHIEWQAHVWLRGINLSLGDYGRAQAHVTQALQICRSLGRKTGEVHCLCNMADLARETRDYAAARAGYEQALRLVPTTGDRLWAAIIQLELGDVVSLQGEYSAAQVLLERALLVFHEIGTYPEEARALAYLGRLHTYLGNYARAHTYFTEFEQVMTLVDSPEMQVEGLLPRAVLMQHSGDQQQALAYAEQGWQLAQRYSHRYNQAHALVVLAHTQADLGLDIAATTYHQALALYAELGNRPLTAEPRAGLAALAWERGDRDQARELVNALLPLLAEEPRVGLDEPFYTYLVCYRILHALDDPRAFSILDGARSLLAGYGAAINDPALRHSFLDAVPTHRELMKATT